MQPKTKIILDTNILMIPGQYKIDIFSEIKRICQFEFELYAIDKSMIELDRIIENGKVKDKTAAKISKQLIIQKGVKIIPSEKGHVDNIILSLAKEDDYVVATLDKELKRRLRTEGIRIITLRKWKYLMFE